MMGLHSCNMLGYIDVFELHYNHALLSISRPRSSNHSIKMHGSDYQEKTGHKTVANVMTMIRA